MSIDLVEHLRGPKPTAPSQSILSYILYWVVWKIGLMQQAGIPVSDCMVTFMKATYFFFRCDLRQEGFAGIVKVTQAFLELNLLCLMNDKKLQYQITGP